MALAGDLKRLLPPDAVIEEPEQLKTYECDGLTGHRVVPSLVVLPATTEQVQGVVRACHTAGTPFVARGAGTGLSAGALPVADGVVVSLTRMNRILEVDLDSERIVVEPGVTNLQVTEAVNGEGYYYAPDPSSQQVCTIGGNVAENSGGAHCLKYGFTVNHVTGLAVVLPDGELLRLLPHPLLELAGMPQPQLPLPPMRVVGALDKPVEVSAALAAELLAGPPARLGQTVIRSSA